VLALTSWLVLSNLVFCYGYMLARQLHSPSAAVTLQLVSSGVRILEGETLLEIIYAACLS
jgi:hypothetical protein